MTFRRATAYCAAAAVGAASAVLVGTVFGTLGAFIAGVVGVGLALVLLSAEADGLPIVAFAAYFAGLAAIADWIPLPDSATLFREQPRQVVVPSPTESRRAAMIGADAEQQVPLAPISSGEAADDADGSDGADELRLADVRRQMVEKVYASAGRELVAELGAKGLAPDDAEIIVRRALTGFSSCMLEAYRSVAGGGSFAVVLDAIEATLSDSDGPVISAVVDVSAARERALPCVANVSQQAGIPFRE